MDKSQEGRAATAQWHSVKLDAASPDLAKACFGQPELPATTPAIHGPQQDCIIDKAMSSPENFTIPALQPANG